MIPQEIVELRDRGALFVANHSGGKDSQAMLAVLREHVPDEQIVVIHADLGDIEWSGAQDHIRNTIGNLPLIVCKNENKTFLEMVEHRKMFPSPQQRQCTSDLKRGPIEREVRRYLKARPDFNGLVVNCMGLRAQESPGRAKAKIFKKSEGNSVAGREWYDWLPIHEMKLEDVWRTIAMAGQEPHPVYAKGMTRFSCKLCIMSNKKDLLTSAWLDPDNLRRYVQMENRIGRTMMMPVAGVAMGLEDYIGIKLDPSVPDHEPARLLESGAPAPVSNEPSEPPSCMADEDDEAQREFNFGM